MLFIQLSNRTFATSNCKKQHTLKTVLLMPFVTPNIVKPEQIISLKIKSIDGIVAWINLTFKKLEANIFYLGNSSPRLDEIPPNIVYKC